MTTLGIFGSPLPSHNAGLSADALPPADARWWTWTRILALQTSNADWRRVIYELTDDELQDRIRWIERYSDGPVQRLLSAWGLPQLDVVETFWGGQVLPELRKQLRRRRAGGAGSAVSGGRFERVKAAVTVEQVAGKHTALAPAGPGKVRGRCPLHDERSASFYVYLGQPQRWHCFGACGAGGDVIGLAQRLMGVGKW